MARRIVSGWIGRFSQGSYGDVRVPEDVLTFDRIANDGPPARVRELQRVLEGSLDPFGLQALVEELGPEEYRSMVMRLTLCDRIIDIV